MNDLSYAVIDAKPRHYDFSTESNWRVVLPLSAREQTTHLYQPAYDFISPLPDEFRIPRDFRRRLIDTTIVDVAGAYHLTVSRLGADLAWSLAASYVGLGFNPPVGYVISLDSHGANEPGNGRIFAAYNRSLDAMVGRCEKARLGLVPF